LAVVLFCADIIAKRHAYVQDIRHTLLPCLVVAGSAAALCVAERDFGSALIFAGIVLAICFIAGMSLDPLVQISSLFAIVGLLLSLWIVASPRAFSRIHGRARDQRHHRLSGVPISLEHRER